MPDTLELTIFDPRSGDTVARVPIADAEECRRAVARARDARRGWVRTATGEACRAVGRERTS
ncbi:hypothetical protein [Mycobacterium innocens]|uniref:hypothetical protein n=1 Tax=Mycobacterium innocens TaxID=2341083 RepID=UPI0009E229C3|nr:MULTISPECIES: hypothetical protein [Mycobacterium]